MSKAKNKVICGASRNIIYKVFIRCLAESQAGKPLDNLEDVYNRTAKFTGVSHSTVRRIASEKPKDGKRCSSPSNTRTGRPSKEINSLNMCAIRHKIQFFYSIKKEVPTIRKLLLQLKKDINYDGSREHLRNLLKKIGFSFKKCHINRQALVEKPLIAHKRECYLHEIMNNRNLPEELQKDIIYLDESYIHPRYILKKCWSSIKTDGIVTDKLNGKRWILAYAGNEKGFVPNALIVFNGNSDMNQSNFIKWVTENLVPNIMEPSIIVMDNAPYHSVIKNKAPTSSNNIAELRQWLLKNNIKFDKNLRAPSLLALVKKHKPEPIYEIDEILGEFGHTVLRIPPYHYDLNPTELIWAKAKQIVSQNIDAKDIKELTLDAFNSITVQDWKTSCDHVKKIERDYYERGRTLYDDIDSLVNQVDTDSSSEDDDDAMSDDVKEVAETSSMSPQTNDDQICQNVEYLDFNLFG